MKRRAAIALALLLAAAFALATFTATRKWSRTGSILKQDGMAYFLYTRSLVLDLDTDVTEELAGIEERFNEHATEAVHRYASRNERTGRTTLPWPIGVAIVQAPAFAAGWGVETLAASAAGRAPDSYGLIPLTAFALGSIFWSLLGVWLVVRMCRRVADERTAVVATLGVALAGPLVFYTFFHPTMSHAPSFGLVAVLVTLFLRRWHDEGGGLVWIGALVGLLAGVRYQNALFGLLPAALVIRTAVRGSVREAAHEAAPALLACATGFAPQVVHLIVNHGLFVGGAAAPQAVADNPMDFTSPHFLDVLLSPKHGAFYWAPLLGVGFVGLLAAGVRGTGWAWLFMAIFLSQTYLVGTLGEINWSAAAAFGMRYLIECTPFIAMGLAWLMKATPERLRLRGWLPVIAALVVLNGGLVVAYSLQTISQEEAVTWGEMARGIGRAFHAGARLLGGGS